MLHLKAELVVLLTNRQCEVAFVGIVADLCCTSRVLGVKAVLHALG